MQFHLNGFEPGDPSIADPELRLPPAGSVGALPRKVDVLIVGCGPAGLTLAAQLSAFPDIKTCIVEQKPGPLLRGQADGIACRTVEMFEAFGFSERVLKEACWINETTFWRPDDKQPAHIVRSGRIQDVEDGLSEFPHVVLNQARVHDFYLDVMRRSAAKIEPYYSRRLVDLEISDSNDADAHRVTARIEHMKEGQYPEIETVQARYVVGCDGARSAVRKSIGRTLQGDSANHAWGVMDVLAGTDFPDVRMKCLIQSAKDGSVIIIPREGGYLFRIYVEMDKLAEHERVSDRKIVAEDVIAAAQRVFRPYTLDVKEVAWWSVYEIGQRLCDKFDDVADGADAVPCVFIAGDACHTHSPKAGQGMNVSMQDGFNLGWKLAAVLRKRAAPHLLKTYSAERHAVAKELIDFDREWAQVISSSKGADPAETQRYFVQHGRYTAGTATRYRPVLLTGEATHQYLAKGFAIGMRFHSAPVIRVADAMAVELGHTVKADGRWRLLAFAPKGDAGQAGGPIRALCEFLGGSPDSPVRHYTPKGADIDAVIDLRAVFQQGHRDIDVGGLPALLRPAKGKFGLTDYEKAFAPDLKGGRDIFDRRGIDRERGCLVVVRPDQYVGQVLPLDGFGELSAYFGGFLVPQA
ncbi:FAD-binding monooxygenase [Undibacter mobilis]|uniref:3-hydroxybenzoate 4-monooxygenase n=1 Tax=Undibacter mobilis TaxID=2292256 RepID=A0A371BCV7_9BRAD|nr:FAD-binding monooxygenase [Undibacter mobilis]RDV05398.1 3-hydroxybenzoate 4-monooxygenase [Undibacter mobilis]